MNSKQSPGAVLYQSQSTYLLLKKQQQQSTAWISCISYQHSMQHSTQISDCRCQHCLQDIMQEREHLCCRQQVSLDCHTHGWCHTQGCADQHVQWHIHTAGYLLDVQGAQQQSLQGRSYDNGSPHRTLLSQVHCVSKSAQVHKERQEGCPSESGQNHPALTQLLQPCHATKGNMCFLQDSFHVPAQQQQQQHQAHTQA